MTRLQWRNPIALLVSSAPWAAAGYLASFLLLGPLWFALGLSTSLVGTVLSLTWVGLPLLLVAIAAVRAMTTVERARAVGVLRVRLMPRPVQATTPSGLLPRVTARIRQRDTWRNLLLIVVLFPWLFALDLVALVLWLMCWALISLPFWYRYPPQDFDNGVRAHGVQLGYYPDGPNGSRRYGWFIDDLHSALISAGVGVILLVLVGNYVVVGAARLHARTVLATLA